MSQSHCSHNRQASAAFEVSSNSINFFRVGRDTFGFPIICFLSATRAHITFLWRQYCFIDKSTRDGRDICADDIITQNSEDEAIDPSEGVDLLSAMSAHVAQIVESQAITNLPSTSYIQCWRDGLCEAGNQRNEADTKSCVCTPIPAVTIVIYSMVFVELVDVKLPFLDEEEVRHHDASQRAHQA